MERDDSPWRRTPEGIHGPTGMRGSCDKFTSRGREVRWRSTGRGASAITDFRFDVDHGIDTVTLQEWTKLPTIRAHTARYLARSNEKRNLEDCAKRLGGLEITNMG
jgi:hypothetical protein